MAISPGIVLSIFGLGFSAGYVDAMARRRLLPSLEAKAIADLSPLRTYWALLEMVAVIAWFALLLLSFLAMPWLWALGLFAGTGLVMGVLAGIVLFGTEIAHIVIVSRVCSAITVAVSVGLWAAYLTH